MNEPFVDEGELVDKEFLPVRQVRIGDTGSTAAVNKWARYTVGPLVCEGDSMFDHAITFKYEDSSIDLSGYWLPAHCHGAHPLSRRLLFHHICVSASACQSSDD